MESLTSINPNVKKNILKFIIEYIQEHGYSPTVREIAQGMGNKSPSTAHKYLDEMLKDGMIETDTGIGSPRAIRVPGYRFVKTYNKRKPSSP